MSCQKTFLLAWLLLSLLSGNAVFQAHSPQLRKASGKQRMNQKELSGFLNRLQADLGKWKRTLDPDVINSLSIQYREGKQIEERYRLVDGWIEYAQQDAEALSKKGGLGSSVRLLVDLEELACSMDGLSGQLGNPVTAEGGDVHKMMEAAGGIISIQKALSLYVLTFQSHTVAVAESADNLVAAH